MRFFAGVPLSICAQDTGHLLFFLRIKIELKLTWQQKEKKKHWLLLEIQVNKQFYTDLAAWN